MSTTKRFAAAALGFGAALYWATRPKPDDIHGQVVLITGGSRGLGFALAKEFGRLGCRVAICARSKDELDKARRLLTQRGIDAFAVTCDVSDPAQVDSMISQVREHFGAVDILVNNAGEILVAPIENTTPADFERALQVMFWGVVYPSLAVLPEMKARGGGRIAAVTSIGGKVSVPHLVAYSCAKSAAVAFCEGLRAEMASSGISVTTIVPGLLRTGSHVNARFKGNRADEAAWFSVGASTPGLAMDADRAASKIVRAVRVGAAERILSPQANLLALLQGVMPGLIPDIMSVVSRLLPEPTRDRRTETSGLELSRRQGNILQTLTAPGRKAGRELNQPV